MKTVEEIALEVGSKHPAFDQYEFTTAELHDFLARVDAERGKEPAEVRYFEQYPGQSIDEIDEFRFNITKPEHRFKLYTTPQPCQRCAEGMVSVTKEDANNHCRILTLLGMEEEGSPVEAVERLISLREGMTCGDCNDTGWLENREEGRYPCTCMTEAEPYQILQAKCAELGTTVVQQAEHTSQLEAVIIQAGVEASKLEAERASLICAVDTDYAQLYQEALVKRDALAAQINQIRSSLDAKP